MYNSNEMTEKRNKLWTSAKAFYDSHINKDGQLNDADYEMYNKMANEVDSLTKQIAIYDRVNAFEEEMSKPLTQPLTSRPYRQDGKLHSSDKNYRTYFWDMIRGLPVENALQLGDDTEGGYLIPDSFENTLVSALEDENVIRKLAHNITTTRGHHKFPVVTGHGSGNWISENSPSVESDDTFGQIWFDAWKVSTMIKVSGELLDESGIDIEKYLAIEFGRRIGRAEEEAFISGNGIHKPTGLLHPTQGAQLGVTTQGSTITADEIIDLTYSLKPSYRKNAVFLVNDKTMNLIIKLKNGVGEYLTGQGLSSNLNNLFGYPIYTSQYMPEVAPGNKALLFGDLSKYWIADRRDRTFKRLNELFAVTGQVGFLASQRLDAKLVLPDACKVLQIKA